jgi:hypothetical protein
LKLKRVDVEGKKPFSEGTADGATKDEGAEGKRAKCERRERCERKARQGT